MHPSLESEWRLFSGGLPCPPGSHWAGHLGETINEVNDRLSWDEAERTLDAVAVSAHDYRLSAPGREAFPYLARPETPAALRQLLHTR